VPFLPVVLFIAIVRTGGVKLSRNGRWRVAQSLSRWPLVAGGSVAGR
jgi:hypothetical protein